MKKLKKKDLALFQRIQTKLIDLVQHPDHYKPLKNVLAGYRRLHFGPVVVICTLENKTIGFISLDHHDKAY